MSGSIEDMSNVKLTLVAETNQFQADCALLVRAAESDADFLPEEIDPAELFVLRTKPTQGTASTEMVLTIHRTEKMQRLVERAQAILAA